MKNVTSHISSSGLLTSCPFAVEHIETKRNMRDIPSALALALSPAETRLTFRLLQTVPAKTDLESTIHKPCTMCHCAPSFHPLLFSSCPGAAERLTTIPACYLLLAVDYPSNSMGNNRMERQSQYWNRQTVSPTGRDIYLFLRPQVLPFTKC